MVRKALVATFCLASALSGCSDKSATSPSATLIVSLSSPNRDDGALVIILRGPELGGVQWIAPSAAVYTRLANPNEERVLVVGDLAQGDLLRVELAGSHPISDYSATISQVATSSDSLRASTEGYRLRLREDRGQ